MTKFNIYTAKGASHGRNKFGIVRTPSDSMAFALYCLNKEIRMNELTSEQFDKAYEQYLIDSGQAYLQNGLVVLK